MKLGFIGAGFVARFQAFAIEQARGIEIAGMVRRRGSEPLAAFCRGRGLGEANIYDSIAEMARQVDALAIFVPNDCRIEVMEEIAAAVKARSSCASAASTTARRRRKTSRRG
jgi:predicted dehydrogenase